MYRLFVVALFAAVACGPGEGRAAERLRVDAVGEGAVVSVTARAVVRAPGSFIWDTITDYSHLAQFVPGIKSSRVIGRRGTAAIVEQDGEVGLLFMKFPIRVLVESAEYPPSRVTIRALRGNLRQLDGQYIIEKGASNNEHVLHWSGVIEPDTMLPEFITVHLMRASIEEQFAGMVNEIERRYAQFVKDEMRAQGN